jgi:hypothetical protein
MKKIIGGCLIATPFVLLFGFVTYRDGLMLALLCFGTTAVIVGVIFAGVKLWFSE